MSDTLATLIITGLGGAVSALAALLWKEALGWKKERDEAREELKHNNNAVVRLTDVVQRLGEQRNRNDQPGAP